MKFQTLSTPIVARRSTEIAEQISQKQKKSILVGMVHVDSALQEMFSSPKIVAIRYAKLLSLTIYLVA